MADNDYKNWSVKEWESFPIDRVCDLLREQPQLVPSCPDSVWRNFKLGHWAKLIREPSNNPNYPVISSHEGRLAVVDKMKELGVAVRVTGSNDAVVVVCSTGQRNTVRYSIVLPRQSRKRKGSSILRRTQR